MATYRSVYQRPFEYPNSPPPVGYVNSPRRVDFAPQQVFTSIERPIERGYVSSQRRINVRSPRRRDYVSGVVGPYPSPEAAIDTEVVNLLETHPEGLVYNDVHRRVNAFLRESYGYTIEYQALAQMIMNSLAKHGTIVDRGRYPHRYQVWVRRRRHPIGWNY